MKNGATQSRISDFFLPEGKKEDQSKKLQELNMKWDDIMVTEYRKKAEKSKTIVEKVRLLDRASLIWERKQTASSNDVDKTANDPESMRDGMIPPIQDLNKPPVMIGGDVKALYPSLGCQGCAGDQH